ncbi:MAG: hypothetical protein PHO89_01190 [Methylacidiphilaceae bacterium]|nr:hypothetical protein [Candidatus Methylacidiphilaceae bacterium]
MNETREDRLIRAALLARHMGMLEQAGYRVPPDVQRRVLGFGSREEELPGDEYLRDLADLESELKDAVPWKIKEKVPPEATMWGLSPFAPRGGEEIRSLEHLAEVIARHENGNE